MINNITREILIGATECEMVVVRMEISDRNKRPELSFMGDTYSRVLFNNSEGMEATLDYLNDSGLWEMAVKDGQTERSKLDFYDEMVQENCWEELLGDVYAVDEHRYATMTGGGQIDSRIKPKDFVASRITQDEIKYIWDCWKKYHLKPLRSMSGETLAKLLFIFENAEEFDHRQLAYYAGDGINE